MTEGYTEPTVIRLAGRIDSANAEETERRIREELAGREAAPLEMNMSELSYISSAGLRVLLRLRKTRTDMKLTGVSPEVYEILDMTGFTEMMTVEKAYREVSIEGCEEIGRGANGRIYRIGRDNVVKVYKNPDALEDIQRERENARTALILGIPTAISYDVVKVGSSYGSVFELLNASSFSKILEDHPEKLDWCVKEFSDMLKKIHSTEVPAGKLPDMKQTVLGWAAFLKGHLPAEAAEKLYALVEAVPQDNHMIHGDYHTKNLELQNDEVLLIDMDTLAVGHPVFELGSMFNSFVGFSELHGEKFTRFHGYDWRLGRLFCHRTLAAYLETEDGERIREVEDKARVIGYARLVRRGIRRGAMENPETREELLFWQENLLELLKRTDTLLF